MMKDKFAAALLLFLIPSGLIFPGSKTASNLLIGHRWDIFEANSLLGWSGNLVFHQNGKVASAEATGEGAVRFEGTYKLSGKRLKIELVHFSEYDIIHCTINGPKEKLDECKEKSLADRVRKQYICNFKSSTKHPKFSKYFACDNDVYLGTAAFAIALGQQREFLKVPIITESKKRFISNEKCSVFNDVGDKGKIVEVFNEPYLPLQTELHTYGRSVRKYLGPHGKAHWYLVQVYSEPMWHPSVWVPEYCLK